MKLLCFCTMFAFWLTAAPSAIAQDMPAHVFATLNRIVGKWTLEDLVDGKKAMSEIEFEWAVPKTTLLFKWKGTDPSTGKPESSVGILGWDPIKQLIVEHEIGSGGHTADSTHIISTDGKWVSPRSGTAFINGKPVHRQEHRIIKNVSDDEWTVTSTDLVIDGKPTTIVQPAKITRKK